MSDQVEIAGRHVQAVTRMLLGAKVLNTGVALLAGGLSGMSKALRVASLARDTDCDLIHLAFERGVDVTGQVKLAELRAA